MTLYLANIPETRCSGITKRIAFAQISNTSRHQIPNNNSKSTNSSSQHLTPDQLAMRTRLQRDYSKTFNALQKYSLVSAPSCFYTFFDRMRRLVELSPRLPITPALVAISSIFENLHFIAKFFTKSPNDRLSIE
ncbi:hypothetical protein AVEN_46161-1 [Araneus ventricosus]|uniref:Uncharacterized protein n=1 Tax=Araneus ventricosus TaxID=182803 RepID=A0A4Y2D973_ARAVE|nr:hypothetical protein AVEN_46161-1 [Araneus ventricosus]